MNWHIHLNVLPYLTLGVLILYLPPRASQVIGKFIESHFGDSIAFYILNLGVAIYVVASFYPQAKGLDSLGNSLVMAAMGVLKLTKVDISYGNGKTPTPPNPPTPPSVIITPEAPKEPGLPHIT